MFRKAENTTAYVHVERPERIFFFGGDGREQLTLEESFGQLQRLYVFFQEELKEPAEAEKRVAGVLRSRRGDGLLFIPRASVNPSNWTFFPLTLSEGRVGFPFGGFCLWIPRWGGAVTSVELSPEKDGFRIHGEGELRWESGLSRRLSKLSLSMTGMEAGCFHFDFSELQGPGDLREMGGSLRYAVKKEEAAGPDDKELVCLFPIELETSARIHGALDVQDPLNPVRSYLEVGPATYSTAFRLLPTGELRISSRGPAASTRLVFQRQQLRRQTGVGSYYLAPSGDFPAENDGRLLPGLCGLEYVKLNRGDLLRFCPGQSLSRESGSTLSFVTVIRGDGGGSPPFYYSQPEARPFFRQVEGPTLDYCEIPFAPMEEETPLPFFPAAGLEERNVKTAAELERMVLSAERLRRMTGVLEHPDFRQSFSQERVRAVTEMGILLEYSEESLRENSFDRVEFADGFVWRGVSGALKAALLSPECFAVIADRGEFAAVCREAELKIDLDGWSFDFSPDTWERQGTVLLLKFARECSIRQYSERSAPWSFATSTGRERLAGMLAELDQAFGQLAEFQELRELVDDPDWCGVLVLSAGLRSGAMPSGLAFLTQGIPGEGLAAHHLILKSRTLTPEGISPSVADGLIYYLSGIQTVEKEADYSFWVTRLIVELSHSLIRSFSCELRLVINRLFGCPTAPGKEAENSAIRISGVYQKDGGAGSYVFALKENTVLSLFSCPIRQIRFERAQLLIGGTAADSAVDFLLEGALDFESGSAQPEPIETIETEKDGTAGKKFDLYSYGFGADESGGLFFSQLCIHMEGGRFSCPPERMCFLPGRSVTRAGSFGEEIPFRPCSLEVHEEDGITPEHLGFTGVNVQHMKQAELSGRWAGILWEISLGGLGTLAELSEPQLQVLTAFSPDDSVRSSDAKRQREDAPARRYVGVRLAVNGGAGGSSPGFSLDLQQFLKLTFRSVELKRRDGTTGTGSYGILIRDFRLKALDFSFPSGGNSIWIFGEPGAKRLAWFAEYKGE